MNREDSHVRSVAIPRKIFVWKTTFWGEESNGWYYDLLYLVCNLRKALVERYGDAEALYDVG